MAKILELNEEPVTPSTVTTPTKYQVADREFIRITNDANAPILCHYKISMESEERILAQYTLPPMRKHAYLGCVFDENKNLVVEQRYPWGKNAVDTFVYLTKRHRSAVDAVNDFMIGKKAYEWWNLAGVKAVKWADRYILRLYGPFPREGDGYIGVSCDFDLDLNPISKARTMSGKLFTVKDLEAFRRLLKRVDKNHLDF